MRLPTDRSRFAFRALAGVLGVALGILLAASITYALRALRPPQSSATDYGRWVLGPCYVVEHGRLTHVRPPSQGDPDWVTYPDFPLVKRPGTRRIAVVGESTGVMVERAMARLAASSGCAEHIEVLECSTFGAHPAFAVRRAREALRYSPDVLVVAIGHNFLNPKPEFRDGDGAWVRDSPVAPDAREVPERAREAYEQILGEAQPRGVQVVALQLASNLLYRPQTDTGYLESPRRARAWALWARGDTAGASKELESAQGEDNAVRAFERALFRTQLGRWAEARDDFIRARELDNSGGSSHSYRASTETNAAIAEAARKGGATVIDVEKLFSSQSTHGIIGWDLIWDRCHPNPGPLELLARTIFQTLAPEGAPGCFPSPAHPLGTGMTYSPPDANLEQTYQQFVGGPLGVGMALPPPADKTDWILFLDNAPLRQISDGPVTLLLRHLPEGAARVLERYDRETLSLIPPRTHAAILAAIGDEARDLGRVDLAAWCLERARTVAPGAPYLVDLAVIDVRLGKRESARTALKEARQIDPGSRLVSNFSAALSEDLGQSASPAPE